MTLTSEQWKEILNSNEGDIFEQIKENLKEKHESIYQEWEEKDFNVNYLFDVSLTIGDQQLKHKLALLHIAAYNGRLDIVKYLVEVVKVNPDQKDEYGKTALHFAAEHDHLDIVEYLESYKNVSLDKNATPRSEKKTIVAASMLAIAGVALGVAVAVYLEMLAMGIAVGACCLVAAAVIYCCNKPSNSLENSSVEAAGMLRGKQC